MCRVASVLCKFGGGGGGGNFEGRILSHSRPRNSRVCISGRGARYIIPTGLYERGRGKCGVAAASSKGRKIICREWRKSAATSRQKGDICRAICNLATGVARALLYPVLSVFVCTAASGDRYISRAREKSQGGKHDAASRDCFRTKKKKRKSEKNTVAHVKAVRAAICTFDTIEHRNSSLLFRALLLPPCTASLPLVSDRSRVAAKIRRKPGIC